MNDLINSVLKKYSEIKAGKPPSHTTIDRQNRNEQTNEIKGSICLIDFEDVPSTRNQQPVISGALLDDFESVNFEPKKLNGSNFLNASRGLNLNRVSPQKEITSSLIPVISNQKETNLIPQSTPANKSSIDVDIIWGNNSLSASPEKANSKHLQSTAPPNNHQLIDFLSDNFSGPENKNSTLSSDFNDCGFVTASKIFEKDGLLITLQSNQTSQNTFNMKAIFLNTTSENFTGINFQVAVPLVITNIKI